MTKMAPLQVSVEALSLNSTINDLRKYFLLTYEPDFKQLPVHCSVYLKQIPGKLK